MTIEWFPGHMAKARQDMTEALRDIDVVVEVIDARVPASSRNPMLQAMRAAQKRPALLVLNMADLADPKQTAAWLAFYKAQPSTSAIALSANRPAEVARLPKAWAALAPGRGTALKPLRLLIAGIPNVGKSTLLNALLKRRVAAVGDEPAVTKGLTRHPLGAGTVITDTPGVMWPGVDQDVAHRLAATHSIGRNAYRDENVAMFLADLLLQDHRPLLAARYGALPDDVDAAGLLAHIARVRGMVKDPLATSSALLLKEFRDGILGRITLETPPSCPTPAGDNARR